MHPLDIPFMDPRAIAMGSDIPLLGDHESPGSGRPIQLVRTNPRQTEALRRLGATEGREGWSMPRVRDFPFDKLAKVLPRFAARTLVPDVVDLIPATSWFASLANMLVGSSWDDIRRPVTSYVGGCQECGTRRNPEAHESWVYDHASGVQTLDSVRSMCFLCHETQHLGRANAGGRLDVVFSRLCRLNRIRMEERQSFREAIFGKWEERSSIEWELDVSAIFSMASHFFLKSPIEFGGDGWVVQPGTASRDEVAIRLVNVEVLTDGRRLVLTPSGTAPRSAVA